MRTTMTALALTAGLSLGGVALVAPGASAQDGGTATASPSASATDRAAARVTAIKEALEGLVSDGTIDQSQADEVASTLATSDALRGGPGGRGGRGDKGGRISPEATAEVLGITVEELRTAREAGKSLAQIAEAEGVSRTGLISGLAAAAEEQIAADVTAGRLTQAQADSMLATLTAVLTEKVDRVRPAHHERGRGGEHPADSSTPGTTPSTSAS